MENQRVLLVSFVFDVSEGGGITRGLQVACFANRILQGPNASGGVGRLAWPGHHLRVLATASRAPEVPAHWANGNPARHWLHPDGLHQRRDSGFDIALLPEHLRFDQAPSLAFNGPRNNDNGVRGHCWRRSTPWSPLIWPSGRPTSPGAQLTITCQAVRAAGPLSLVDCR